MEEIQVGRFYGRHLVEGLEFSGFHDLAENHGAESAGENCQHCDGDHDAYQGEAGVVAWLIFHNWDSTRILPLSQKYLH